MGRQRSRIKKASLQTSSASSSQASSLRTAGPCRTTTSRRNPRSTWCFASEEALYEIVRAQSPVGVNEIAFAEDGISVRLSVQLTYTYRHKDTSGIEPVFVIGALNDTS